MMHFSQQEIRNNCSSKKKKKNAFTIPVKPSFLHLSVTGPAERERERERGDSSCPACRRGGELDLVLGGMSSTTRYNRICAGDGYKFIDTQSISFSNRAARRLN